MRRAEPGDTMGIDGLGTEGSVRYVSSDDYHTAVQELIGSCQTELLVALPGDALWQLPAAQPAPNRLDGLADDGSCNWSSLKPPGGGNQQPLPVMIAATPVSRFPCWSRTVGSPSCH